VNKNLQSRRNRILVVGVILAAILLAVGALAGVSPSSGPVSGGTAVTITGSNIGSGSDITNVTICGVAASIISSQSTTQVVVLASSSPSPLASGPVCIYSISRGVSVLSNAYSYVADAGSISVGLVAYYPFNGNANDASGNGNHAAMNTALLAADRFGQSSSAYLFSSNAFMEMASGLPDMTSVTISLWVNAAQLSDTVMMWEGDVWPAQDITLGIRTNDLRFATKSSDGFLVWTSTGLSTGQWYHLTFIGNSDTGQKQIWLNGSMVASASRTGPFGIGHHYKLQVGRVYDGSNPPSGYFRGLLDEIRVYNRAISADEVWQLYQGGTAEISGTISYSGSQTGQVVLAVGSHTNHIAGPGAYSFTNLPMSSSCSISAFLDVNGNNECDISEPCGEYAGNPVNLTNNLSGVDITLTDSSTIDRGLVAYYPFNGNANDASGNGNHAATNTALLAADRFGQANSAYLFNSNAFIEMTSGLPDMTSVTISLWVNAAQLSDTVMMWEGDVWPAQDITLGIRTNDIRFATKSSDGFLVWTSPGLTTGQWHNLTFVGNNEAGQKQIWLNGSLVSSANRPGPFGLGHHYKLQIGRNYDGSNPPSNFFCGLIDDIRVYNRALSGLEVTALYELYMGQPQAVTLSVTNGPAMGGNTVVITGECLGDGSDITNVTICGVIAAIQGQTSNSVTVIMGAGGVGVGNIVVKSTSRGTATFIGAYTYNPQGVISGDLLRWASVSNFPVARGMMGAAVAGGRIYAMGGYNYGWNTSAYSYDPETPTQGWKSVTSLPAACGCLASVSVGGKIYAIGGQNGVVNFAQVYVYDPLQPASGWGSISNMPLPLGWLAATVSHEKIYVLGGDSTNGTQSGVYEYDPGRPAQGWRFLNNMPAPRNGLAAVELNGIMYAIGGYYSGQCQSSAWAYDPLRPEVGWQSISNIPAARTLLSAVSVDGKIVVMGGRADSPMSGTTTVYIYDPSRPTLGWLSASNMPGGKVESPAVGVNGKIYNISGATAPLTYTPAVYEGSFSSGVAPSSGPKTGGTTVVINGSNLGNGTDITNVTLCGVAASIVSQSGTHVVVTAGSSLVASNGAVVVYSASYGVTVASNAYSYVTDPPAAPGVLPATAVTVQGFSANWTSVDSVENYRLDVSAVSNFTSCLSGYNNLNVGAVTTYAVSGLNAGMTYFYRVRSQQNGLASSNSAAMSVATSGGLLSLSNGPAVGGNTLIITSGGLGNGLDITNVTICGVVASIQSQTSNSVTVIVGAGGVGAGNIVVKSTSFGTTTFAGAYTYNPQGYILGASGFVWGIFIEQKRG